MKYSQFSRWLLLPLTICLIKCAPSNNPPAELRGSVNKYSEPAFEDSTSFSRLNAAFPVIDKLFSDYAKENNMPAIAFGVIANGKLIHSGATGIANLEK